MESLIYVLTTNGLLFFLSIIFWKFPPKKINNWYGYRTYKTMQNEEIWNFANNTFNHSLIKYSGIAFVASLILATISSSNLSWQPMLLVILTILVCVIITEKSLKEHFTDEGKRKN